jgi:hypothetical protein
MAEHRFWVSTSPASATCLLEQTRETLDIWPSLPIIMKYFEPPTSDVDDILAALERHDRVCQITLWGVPSRQLAAVKEPFPVLTHLWLMPNYDEMAPVQAIPDSFLGGSAPHLRLLFFKRVPFPGLPNYFFSATNVTLSILHFTAFRIPVTFPETMADCMSTSTGLKKLVLKFESPRSRPVQESRRPPPRTRSVLPALIDFSFTGISEYLEDLVARVDGPLLIYLSVTFFHQLILHTPQLTQFISRTPTLKLNGQAQARVLFSGSGVSCVLPLTANRGLALGISCRQVDWQLLSLAQFCASSFPRALIQSVEHLYIQEDTHRTCWQDDIDNSQWLELLHPFTAVKSLYLSKEIVLRIASFQELVGERVLETLPVWQSIYVEELPSSGPVREETEKFVAARQLSNHPIAISSW